MLKKEIEIIKYNHAFFEIVKLVILVAGFTLILLRL